jgi:hypothetical protein
MARKDLVQAVAYLRTSSAANVGADKDSEKRQRAAIEAYARAAGFTIVDSYYDEAVGGADPVTTLPGFAAMMERIASNGVRTIIVETANRFMDGCYYHRFWCDFGRSTTCCELQLFELVCDAGRFRTPYKADH